MTAGNQFLLVTAGAYMAYQKLSLSDSYQGLYLSLGDVSFPILDRVSAKSFALGAITLSVEPLVFA